MIQDVLTRFEQYNKEMSPLGDAMDGTKLQAQLQQYKRIRITGNYILPTDIVLYEGMTLLIDQAVVSMAGNIALRGGELHISNSRLVRTSNSHRRAQPCDPLSFSRLLFCRIRWSINASRRAGCGL